MFGIHEILFMRFSNALCKGHARVELNPAVYWRNLENGGLYELK
jgi:hypothetical protein